MIKNIEKSLIIRLKDEVNYQKGQVVSKTITKSKSVNISLFAFDQNEGLSTHTATGDALVTILDGEANIVIDGKEFVVCENQTIVLPANIPHSLQALKPFKMLLVIVFGND